MRSPRKFLSDLARAVRATLTPVPTRIDGLERESRGYSASNVEALDAAIARTDILFPPAILHALRQAAGEGARVLLPSMGDPRVLVAQALPERRIALVQAGFFRVDPTLVGWIATVRLTPTAPRPANENSGEHPGTPGREK